MNRLIEYYKVEAKVESDFLKAMGVIAGVFSINSFFGAWLKKYIDDVKTEQRVTEKALLKDYMDKDDTIKMYSLMSAAHEQKLDGLSTRFDKMDSKIDILIELEQRK